MPEPRRFESPAASGFDALESQADRLLVDGLDRYFSGQYEEAIHVWTRVLFLDRSHERARAYIERARTAIAERQRRAEEMLHRSGELVAQGQIEEARRLLAHVVTALGDDERAAALRLQLERVERTRASDARVHPAPAANPRSASTRTFHAPSLRMQVAAVAMLAVCVFGVFSPWGRDAMGWGNVEPVSGVGNTSESLRVLSTSEVALVRAQTLYARGRLAEALQALDRVDSESTNRVRADELRVEIQQVLLAADRALRRIDATQAGHP